jgi:hypothetical protein
MSNGNSAPTHLDQVEEALEERQNPDRRQQPTHVSDYTGEDRRKEDRRNRETNV